MAHAKICDRCGGVYGKNSHMEEFGPDKYGTVKGVCVMFEDTDRDTVAVNGVMRRKNAYMDLCDDCAKQLSLFLKDAGAKVEPSVKTVTMF